MSNTVEDAFRKVLAKYKTGDHSRYICVNLMVMEINKEISESQETKAKKIINEFLDGHTSLEGWLYSIHGIKDAELFSDRKKINQTRINWLKYLVKYCKKNKF